MGRAGLLAVILGLPGIDAVAQAASEPPVIQLPVGARVRLRVAASPERWVNGSLTDADSGSLALLPEGAPPFAGRELRLRRESVSQLEIATRRKRQWLAGLVVGAAVGVALGFAVDVDPVQCEFDSDYACSRGEAIALVGVGTAALGAGVGALVKKDVWMPVALDALGPPPARVGAGGPRLRATPHGLSLELAVRF